MEPLYCGHHWDPSECHDFKGVLNSDILYLGQKKVSISGRGVHIEGFHCITCFSVFD